MKILMVVVAICCCLIAGCGDGSEKFVEVQKNRTQRRISRMQLVVTNCCAYQSVLFDEKPMSGHWGLA